MEQAKEQGSEAFSLLWSCRIRMQSLSQGRIEIGCALSHQTAGRAEHAATLHGTSGIIVNPHTGVRLGARRVKGWQTIPMVRPRMASADRRTEKNFRRIMGYPHRWAPEAILSPASQQAVAWKQEPRRGWRRSTARWRSAGPLGACCFF
jgi:hypothetical protein